MKSITLILFVIISSLCFAQNSADTLKVITKHDGTQYVGKILSDDGREVLIETTTIGKVYISKENISLIRTVTDTTQVNEGKYYEGNIFATRYFFSTNGFPIEKKQSYVMLSVWGPEFQYAVAKNFSAGLMTTWIGAPMVLSLKYSGKIAGKVSGGIGLLAGSSTWLERFRYQGLVGYGTVTYGTHEYNLSISGGYAGMRDFRPEKFYNDTWDKDGNYIQGTQVVYEKNRSGTSVLGSLCGTARIGKKAAFVMENFYFRDGAGSEVILIIPGVRFTTRPNFAFQFGCAGLLLNNVSIPIPFFSWMMKI